MDAQIRICLVSRNPRYAATFLGLFSQLSCFVMSTMTPAIWRTICASVSLLGLFRDHDQLDSVAVTYLVSITVYSRLLLATGFRIDDDCKPMRVS
jgi:hypothetical protein